MVLLHGLTAVRRYVVMGSKALHRSGHRVISYDARGHGRSAPAPSADAYGYADLEADLESVLDAAEVERAVIAGASMGAHTAVRLALNTPDRVAGLVLLTPAHDPETADDPGRLARWDALAEGLRSGGVEGFVEAYGDEGPERWLKTIRTVLRQRLSAHEHPAAVADALQAVPRSHPFERTKQLAAIGAPTAIVASRDEADPGHPLAIGQEWAGTIPGAELHTEEPGASPLAWQGGRVSKVIAGVAARART